METEVKGRLVVWLKEGNNDTRFFHKI